MSRKIYEINHPLVQHKLTLMRNKDTCSMVFRTLLKEISLLLAYDVFKDLDTTTEEIETPLEKMEAPVLKEKQPILISILRAGNGFLDGFLEILPTARVGHIGLYRDEVTHEAIEYYFKLPAGIENRDVVVIDPMLATGHTAVAAIQRIKDTVNPRTIKFLCLVSAPEGIETLHQSHPDVKIYTAAIDNKLNDECYILPGLGDAGDRIYGTKSF